jgi:hypothetical protein
MDACAKACSLPVSNYWKKKTPGDIVLGFTFAFTAFRSLSDGYTDQLIRKMG